MAASVTTLATQKEGALRPGKTIAIPRTDHVVGPPGAGGGTVELEGRRHATKLGLADLLGVATRTLARWDERRMGPTKIKVGNLVLYDLAKLHGWLESHERTAFDGSKGLRRKP